MRFSLLLSPLPAAPSFFHFPFLIYSSYFFILLLPVSSPPLWPLPIDSSSFPIYTRTHANTPAGSYPYGGYYAEYDGSSEHSGTSVSGGSRPASSAGGGNYSPYLPNGRHHASASLDLHDLHRPPDMHDMQRPPEFSNAFGLMSLDDPNVLAGLANDGVPFFSHAPTHNQHHTPRPQTAGSSNGGDKRMQLVPPLAYQPYGAPPGPAQTPGSASAREAETRELREFWKAYMRTPLTGPPGGGDALGLATPMAGPNGGRRFRVASLPSVKTPENELDAGAGAGYPVHPAPPQGRTMHNADDLRSYEAAVLARKAPELVLRKPGKRPATSAGAAGAPPPPVQPPFEFGREASQSSLAGAFGFAGQGYATQPGQGQGAGSQPNSPFPGTPSSASAPASASASSDGEGEEHGGRPSFKRLPSQTLGPPQAKRRRDRPGMSLALGPPEMDSDAGAGMGGGAAPGGGAGGGGPTDALSVNAYPDRPMIALRAPPNAHPQRRTRRLSAPASPTAPGFVI
ncbi:hypothetical protein B0H15DRAFT_435633 [Mycena belliarum]|uniref:Uncharacterized protein n=1 Tax=Mycena belliarum TaxID=1033014 RepID=A0AAD6TWZ9_9AGAR|nr:hypothetical protein B0H15DRAFT_435633 [Mycena belliae]